MPRAGAAEAGIGPAPTHNAADGTPLWATSLGVDSGKVCGTGLTSGGVSIAHHTVIANCDGTLTAYRLS